MGTKAPKIAGIISLIAALALIITGAITWGLISTQLSNEKITVASDARWFGGQKVTGPFTAYAQADIIKTHALHAAEDLSYAELGAKIAEAKGAKNQADVDKYTAMRTTAMNGSFLRSSLFTSVLAFGVSLFAIGMGIMLGLLGWALLALAGVTAARRHDAATEGNVVRDDVSNPAR